MIAWFCYARETKTDLLSMHEAWILLQLQKTEGALHFKAMHEWLTLRWKCSIYRSFRCEIVNEILIPSFKYKRTSGTASSLSARTRAYGEGATGGKRRQRAFRVWVVDWQPAVRRLQRQQQAPRFSSFNYISVTLLLLTIVHYSQFSKWAVGSTTLQPAPSAVSLLTSLKSIPPTWIRCVADVTKSFTPRKKWIVWTR